MKKVLVFCVFVFSIMQVCATRRALIIGIGSYPARSGWAQINGDKDIPLVKQMLLKNDFREENMQVLQNEQATFSGICSAFEKLISSSETDDIVYIHFSGHGQQITDINGDEPSGMDEAWIPYDAQYAYKKGVYEGENHLVDDKLNDFLMRLRQKIGEDGKIVVVADACHSGGGTAANGVENKEEYVVRGSQDAFVVPAVAVSFDNKKQNEIDWVFISACKSYQCNYEYRGNGSLTYCISEVADIMSELSYTQLQSELKRYINKIIPFPQTPQVEVPEKRNTIPIF